MVGAFSERAESVRAGLVNPTEDNMLKITNDGRKCALDQRLLNELLPDAEKSKVNTCVENAFQGHFPIHEIDKIPHQISQKIVKHEVFLRFCKMSVKPQ